MRHRRRGLGGRGLGSVAGASSVAGTSAASVPVSSRGFSVAAVFRRQACPASPARLGGRRPRPSGRPAPRHPAWVPPACRHRGSQPRHGRGSSARPRAPRHGRGLVGTAGGSASRPRAPRSAAAGVPARRWVVRSPRGQFRRWLRWSSGWGHLLRHDRFGGLRSRRSGLMHPVAGVVRARHAGQCPTSHPGHCSRDRVLGAGRSAAVAFCPAPPLLLPAVEGRPDVATSSLRQACAEAVGALLAVQPDAVVVVGAGAAAGRAVRRGRRAATCGASASTPRCRSPGRPARTDDAFRSLTRSARGCSTRPVRRRRGSGSGPDDLGPLVRRLPGSRGGARHGRRLGPAHRQGPGVPRPGRRALRRPRRHRTGGGRRGRAGRARPRGGGAAARRRGPDLASRRCRARRAGTFTARLHLDDAPFGVGYLVADWTAA